MEEKIRFGGMALVNGVLVHGPHSWACAVRTPDGELKVAAEYKRFRAAEVTNPLLRGPARRSSRSCRRFDGGCRRRGCRSSDRRCSRRWPGRRSP
jgi:hypothetical protein